MAAPTMSMAAQPPVNLGTTSTFAILAGSEITNTGMTIISGSAGGDVGLSPGTAFTGQANVTTSGSVHIANAIAIEAKEDLITAYNDAAGRTPVTRISTELGGTTLTPGTYDSADGTLQITGTLTLDAQGDPDGVFVFKTASSLITASDSHVNLINGAQSCNIFWKVGSSATLGTNSHFVGHIFALASITANNGATVQGQLLARNGAVTLDNNVIINESCDVDPIPPAPAILHVIKHVINSNGGTAVAGNFNLHVKTSGNDVATSPQPGVEAPGTSYTLPVGNYVVSEDASAEYIVSYSGDSDSSGNITLASGDNKTVIITNNDVNGEPQIDQPLINVIITADPLALTSGPGLVTYIYEVTNPGKVELSNVSVTDDKTSSVNYVSGDVNADNLLQSDESWIYTGETHLNESTTSTATAKGSANDMTATDISSVTVVVTPLVVTPPVITPPVVTPPVVTPPVITPPVVTPPVVTPPVVTPPVVTTTVTGGQLPKTSTPLYDLLLVGVALTLLGAIGLRRSRKRYNK